MKELQTKHFCNNCNALNIVSAVNIKKAEFEDSEGLTVFVIYYKCKQCNRINVLQLDNYESKKLFMELKELTKKCIKKGMEGKTISPKDKDKRIKIEKKLKKIRAGLNEKYEGKTLHSNDISFVVNMSEAIDN